MNEAPANATAAAAQAACAPAACPESIGGAPAECADAAAAATSPRPYTPPAIIYCAPLEALAGDCMPSPPGKDPISCMTGLS